MYLYYPPGTKSYTENGQTYNQTYSAQLTVECYELTFTEVEYEAVKYIQFSLNKTASHPRYHEASDIPFAAIDIEYCQEDGMCLNVNWCQFTNCGGSRISAQM